MAVLFKDRGDAGRQLADLLARYRGTPCVVLGLPRGGVPVAAAVAEAIGAPLDVLVSRKIGYPGNPELAIGAVTARGTRVLNEELLEMEVLPPGYLEEATEAARRLAQERETGLRAAAAEIALQGKTVILVDDGIATGMTMLAAIRDVRAQAPARLVVAAPVVSPATEDRLGKEADELVYVDAPSMFWAIGQFYEDFSQVSDEEVRKLLVAHRAAPTRQP